MPPRRNHEPKPSEPNEPTERCEMCRRETPTSQVTVVHGRRLCFGCAAAFFEDEEG